MSGTTKSKASGKLVAVWALQPVLCNGTLYQPGAAMQLPADSAEQLLALGHASTSAPAAAAAEAQPEPGTDAAPPEPAAEPQMNAFLG